MLLLGVACLDPVVMVSAASHMRLPPLHCPELQYMASLLVYCGALWMGWPHHHTVCVSIFLYGIICVSLRCLLLPAHLSGEVHFELPLSSCGDLSAGLQSVAPLAASGSGDGVLHGDGPGILEIKCPFNRGDPNSAAPPKLAQWYYMPQVSFQ